MRCEGVLEQLQVMGSSSLVWAGRETMQAVLNQESLQDPQQLSRFRLLAIGGLQLPIFLALILLLPFFSCSTPLPADEPSS